MSAPPTTTEGSVEQGTGGAALTGRRPRWLPVALQALWPGLGYFPLGWTGVALATTALWPITVITTHMRIVEGEGNAALRTGIWAGLVAALWLSSIYHVATVSRGSVAAMAPGALPGGRHAGIGRWLLGRSWLLIAGTLFLIDRMALDAEVNLPELFDSRNIAALRRMSSGLFRPDFSVLRLVIADYAWVTLEMAVIGTIIGALVAAPISFLGARNLLARNPVTAPIYYITRFVLGVIRSIPTLIWGLLAISVVSLGHFPGVIALSIFSFGLTAKLFSESIEAIDEGPVEAVTAAGANPLHTLIFGVVPQVVPYFISAFLYCLEVNVHSSVVLGLIGAGGLGLIVNEYIATFHWEQASTVLLVTIVMTLSIDYVSAYIRGRIV